MLLRRQERRIYSIFMAMCAKYGNQREKQTVTYRYKQRSPSQASGSIAGPG